MNCAWEEFTFNNSNSHPDANLLASNSTLGCSEDAPGIVPSSLRPTLETPKMISCRADLPRARAGGTDGAGPSASPVRLPEGDDLFGLGMTGFVPGDAPGAGTGAGQQPSELSLHALALQQSSPAHRDVLQQQQQQLEGGLGFGPADGRRPSSAGSVGALPSPSRWFRLHGRQG